MTAYRWRNGDGIKRQENVATVVWQPHHIAFYDTDGRLLLAERATDVQGLREETA